MRYEHGAFRFGACIKCKGDLVFRIKHTWDCVQCGHQWYIIKGKITAVRHDPNNEERYE